MLLQSEPLWFLLLLFRTIVHHIDQLVEIETPSCDQIPGLKEGGKGGKTIKVKAEEEEEPAPAPAAAAADGTS